MASRIRRTLEIRAREAPSTKALVEMSVDSCFLFLWKIQEKSRQRAMPILSATEISYWKKGKEYQTPNPKLFCKLVVVVKANVLSEGG